MLSKLLKAGGPERATNVCSKNTKLTFKLLNPPIGTSKSLRMQKDTTICSLYSYLTTCLFTGIRLHQPTPLLPPCIWKAKEVKKPVKHIICKGQPSTSDQIKSILRSATTRVSIFRGSLLICLPGLVTNALFTISFSLVNNHTFEAYLWISRFLKRVAVTSSPFVLIF